MGRLEKGHRSVAKGLEGSKELAICTKGDYLKVFLHLEERGVSEYTPWSGLLCGSLRDIPQVLYSSRSTLILELHTGRVQTSNSTGFSGTFRYIDRREYIANI
ncbi:hypothetical protein PV326_011180 [Microctonus aethiopoides]|uniref:Uncharacterized protein n=1 Tax=Microctonus aethiopoides TaxID=144406 RepID=A0AA39C4N2_9HYME|nr:hypothetical protein PV326_011180 [Microctonus aethiopoides]KAK0157758.1 hypothetical protein PV328_011456 [Microctonus aethiopoides]